MWQALPMCNLRKAYNQLLYMTAFYLITSFNKTLFGKTGDPYVALPAKNKL